MEITPLLLHHPWLALTVAEAPTHACTYCIPIFMPACCVFELVARLFEYGWSTVSQHTRLCTL